LTTRTCTGGFIFSRDGALFGILLRDAFTYLMDYQHLGWFVHLYSIYESSNFNFDEVRTFVQFGFSIKLTHLSPAQH
jgi:hypothetical protein